MRGHPEYSNTRRHISGELFFSHLSFVGFINIRLNILNVSHLLEIDATVRAFTCIERNGAFIHICKIRIN